ncbi:nitrile hydratase accessory protein [Paraburkholderia sp.]|uniref:nitrile hydratase accessory protein n=1 Tax=Paraburkholderia sp. TaxID=1926495 RepID=UPI00238E8736|nr:nitrile hydratase accessory protein [Paraburkholderia sp.]MDE1180761.1 nitrile hydratase accessory protein [Paraburkholderia sp.]
MTPDHATLAALRAALPDLPCDDAGPVFNAPWQASAFALAMSLLEQGRFTRAEWAQCLGDAIRDAQRNGDPDLGDTYYLHWLTALERISVSKGLATSGMLAQRRDEWAIAARNTPHGQPVRLP